MFFLHWEKNKLTILSKITLFRVKSLHERFVYYFCGIPVWCKVTPLSRIIYEFKKNKNFDTRKFDKELENIAPIVNKMENILYADRVAVLATELSDNGGHSKCIQDLVTILSEKYRQHIFLTNYSQSLKKAPSIMSHIARYALLDGENIGNLCWRKKIIKLFYEICTFSPKVIFIYIHPDDVYGTMLLSMIKKYTNIKIYYAPHASHYPNLGTSFADITLEGMPLTAYITQKMRKCTKTYVIGMISKKQKDFPVITKEEIFNCRKKLGLQETELCTMSGGSSYKFFDSQESSEYFNTVKLLLERNYKVKHVVVSNFSNAERYCIERIFENSKTRDRLILHPLTKEYELLFCCADVFIDSFPVSGALTMIDLMRLKVPAVVKINRENPLWSFHEYQRPDFPYMFDNNKDFLCGIEELLYNKGLREVEKEKNYQFYLKKYEGDACKLRLYELIDNSDRLEAYYTVFDSEVSYNIKGVI